MAKTGGGDDEMIIDINMVPFIDIVLVLLIIFMVTARMMTPPSIPLELPKASTGVDQGEPPMAISLSYASADQPAPMYLNGRSITIKQLESEISEAVSKKKTVQVIIAADRRVTHGNVISLLDLLRRLGVEQYAFNIDPQ
jgi:biopolymer transport protein ExbD